MCIYNNIGFGNGILGEDEQRIPFHVRRAYAALVLLGSDGHVVIAQRKHGIGVMHTERCSSPKNAIFINDTVTYAWIFMKTHFNSCPHENSIIRTNNNGKCGCRLMDMTVLKDLNTKSLLKVREMWTYKKIRFSIILQHIRSLSRSVRDIFDSFLVSRTA